MATGLNPKVEVKGLDKLEKYIEYVKKFSTMRSDRQFQKYMQNKFLETVNKITLERASGGELTNSYIDNNKIRELDDGFVLYNDTYVETDTEGYGGQFCIALAFEYGTGLVGQENAKPGAWQYNVNQHEKGWYYYKDGTFHFTRGFEGYEIYRFTLEEIKNKLMTWVNEYDRKNGGVSQ